MLNWADIELTEILLDLKIIKNFISNCEIGFVVLLFLSILNPI